MRDASRLESDIHNLGSVKELVDTLIWRYADHPEPMTEDQVINSLLAISNAFDLHWERLFDTYKQVYQLDEYATPEQIAHREEAFRKLFKKIKKAKKIDIDGRC